MSKRPVLLHVWPSYFSTIARLVLIEKQVDFQSVIIDMHLGLEYFEPWYVKLNPNITIPTFIHENKVITSSLDMLSYVDNEFNGPALKPSDPVRLETMNALLAQHNEVQIELLTMGAILAKSPLMQKKMISALKKQEALCIERSKLCPDLRESYDAKLTTVKQHIDQFSKENLNESRKIGETQSIAYLNTLEETLSDKGWLLGDDYSLCDIVCTSFLGRLAFIKRLDMLHDYPKCQGYWVRIKARPSFKKANVPTKFFPPYLIAAVFWRLLRRVGLLPTNFLSSE